MTQKESVIEEFKREANGNRKILERVPFEKADWKPHEKSMSIARLASHLAENTGWITEILQNDELDFAGRAYKPYVATSKEDLLTVFQDRYDKALAALEAASDQDLEKHWLVRVGPKVMQNNTKLEAIRGWTLSHMIHHRGQLSVYLRMLDVAVPGMYGPSADEK